MPIGFFASHSAICRFATRGLLREYSTNDCSMSAGAVFFVPDCETTKRSRKSVTMMSPLKSVSQTTRKEDDKLHQKPLSRLCSSPKFMTEAKKLIERPEKIPDIFPYTSRDIFLWI